MPQYLTGRPAFKSFPHDNPRLLVYSRVKVRSVKRPIPGKVVQKRTKRGATRVHGEMLHNRMLPRPFKEATGIPRGSSNLVTDVPTIEEIM